MPTITLWQILIFLCFLLHRFVQSQDLDDTVSLATPATESEPTSFTSTKEFRAIMGGVAGFWGGVFSMGSIYLLMVFAKRVFNPEEGDEKGSG